MKRFLIFANKYFDAKGGFMDLCHECETLEQAKEFVKGLTPPEHRHGQEHMDGWWQIVDIEERWILLSNRMKFRFPIDGKYGRRRIDEKTV